MPDSSDVTVGRLQRLLRGLATRKPITQAIVAVESGDQSFRWIGAEGETISGDQVVEETPFFIASIDKLYNATIAMMLSEAGWLDVDKAITAYLPEAITRGLHQYRGIDFSEKITVRHLLSHTSGLADWLEDYPRGGPSLIDKVLEEGDRMLTIEEIAIYVRDCLRPHFPPQDLSAKRPRARYSDTRISCSSSQSSKRSQTNRCTNCMRRCSTSRWVCATLTSRSSPNHWTRRRTRWFSAPKGNH